MERIASACPRIIESMKSFEESIEIARGENQTGSAVKDRV